MLSYALLLLLASPILSAPPNSFQQLAQTVSQLPGQILKPVEQQFQPHSQQYQQEGQTQSLQEEQPTKFTLPSPFTKVHDIAETQGFTQGVGLQVPHPAGGVSQVTKTVVARAATEHHPVSLFLYYLPPVFLAKVQENSHYQENTPVVGEKVQQYHEATQQQYPVNQEQQNTPTIEGKVHQQQTPSNQYQENYQGKGQPQYQEYQESSPAVQEKLQPQYQQYQQQQYPANQDEAEEGQIQGKAQEQHQQYPINEYQQNVAVAQGKNVPEQYQQQTPIQQYTQKLQQDIPINQYQGNNPIIHGKQLQENEQLLPLNQYQSYVPVVAGKVQQQYQNQEYEKTPITFAQEIVPQIPNPQKIIPFQTQQQQQTQQYPIAPSEKIIPQAQQQVNQQQGQSQVQEKSAGSGPQHLEQQQSTFASQQLTNIQNTPGEYHGFASQQEAAPQISSKSSEFHGQPQGNAVAPVGNVPVHVVQNN